MRPATQLIGSFALLLLLQAATALVAIALLGRMSPAFERIMVENVTSAEAVEQMAIVLASPALDDAARARYRTALERASSNLTEPEELPLVAELRALAEPTLAGESDAQRRSLAALEQLGRVNREAMAGARDEARRLGMAGAWAVTLLAMLTLGVSFIAVVRTRSRWIAPLSEIARVVAAHQAGERRQRCTRAAAEGDEITQLGAALNDLLDYSERAHAKRDNGALERAVLLGLLDERAEPAVVVDAEGELLAASQLAEALLAGERGPELRSALRAACQSSESDGRVRAKPLGQTGARLCVLDARG